MDVDQLEREAAALESRLLRVRRQIESAREAEYDRRFGYAPALEQHHHHQQQQQQQFDYAPPQPPPPSIPRTNTNVGGTRSKYCTAEGCTNRAVSRGVCQRHGYTPKRCKIEGCTNQSIKGGVCVRHGAKRPRHICNVEGCTSKVYKGGRCVRHGAGCSVEGCTSRARKDGVCIKHGGRGNRVCRVEGCNKYPKEGGVCHAHGRPPRVCCKEGCANFAVRGPTGLGRVCEEHKGVKAPPKSAECEFEGCDRKVRGKRTMCAEHAKLERKAKKMDEALPSTKDDDFFAVCTCYSNTDTVCGMHGVTKRSREEAIAAAEDDEEEDMLVPAGVTKRLREEAIAASEEDDDEEEDMLVPAGAEAEAKSEE